MGRPDHRAAELAEHILDQHGDHHLVLDDENPTTLKGRATIHADCALQRTLQML